MNKLKLDVEHLFNKAVWAILIALCGFGVKKVSDVSDSITTLNQNVAVILTNLGQDKEEIKDHELRLRAIEGRTHAPVDQ